MLQNLYDRSRDDFILATGFGPIRMGSVYREALVLDDDGPISLKEHLQAALAASSSSPSDADGPAEQPPGKLALSQLHESGLRDLFDPQRLGYVKGVDEVAGFQSHRYTRLPRSTDTPESKWVLVRLELIGLLKYDRPKAYVTENLPRLAELGEAATATSIRSSRRRLLACKPTKIL